MTPPEPPHSIPRTRAFAPRTAPHVCRVALGAATIAALLTPGCRRPAGAVASHAPQTAVASSVVTDPVFVHAGSILASRDIDYLVDRLRRRQAAIGNAYRARDAQRLGATAGFLERGRAAYPQAVKFRIDGRGSTLSLIPLDWRDAPAVRRTVAADVVIVGGEIEAVVTAIAAADRGMRVALVYAGPLGGLVSDSGGNLRYFDGIPGTPRPREQLRLFHDGLGMAHGNLVAVPTNVSARLARFLTARYAGRIQLVQTATYNSLHVGQTGGRITQLLTDEGAAVHGNRYVDMDPESRVAEKAGLPVNVDTPNLSCGVVFDVTGLNAGDWARLRSAALVSPERILGHTGVSAAAMHPGSQAAQSVKRQRKRMRNNFVSASTYYRFGYAALAEGFNLYMQCLGMRDPSNADLRWLNAARCTSGFNVSLGAGRATFNSVSYHLPAAVLQHDHDLHADPRFRPIREVDMPALARYLQWVTGNPRVRVTMPSQFYVRRPTAYFATAHPYGPADFEGRPRTHLWMIYEMDFRDARPRDPFESALYRAMFANGIGRKRWDCRADSTDTRIPNLFLLNKCAMTPRYSGGLRILQNLTSTGVALMVRFHGEVAATGHLGPGGTSAGAGGAARTPGKKGSSIVRTHANGRPTTL